MLNKTIRTLLLVVSASAAVTAIGMGFANAKTASHARWRISAFSRHSTHALSADALPSAVAADTGVVVAIDHGANKVYLSQRHNQSVDCLYDHISMEAGGGSCGSARRVEEQGMVNVLETQGNTTRVLALVPDGVTNMVVTNQDGSPHEVRVEDNTAVYEDSTPETVSITLPNGAVQSWNVRAWATPLAQLRPSPPGSSE